MHGAALRIEVSPDAREVAPAHVDLSSAPGMEVVLQRAWDGPSGRVELACAHAGSSWWLAELEDPLLAAAASLVRTRLGLSHLELGAKVRTEQAIYLPYSGARGPQMAHGQLLLGFLASDHELLLCSSACLSEGSRCTAPIAVEAGLVARPPRSRWEPVFELGAGAMLLLSSGFCFGLVALILWTRPRPRR